MYHVRKPELEPPRRVLIIGSPGADKTSLGRAIADRLRIPLIELERLYWRPGWTPPAESEWQKQVGELAAGQEWVMVGTFPSALDVRVARADWLIFLDAPMPSCFMRRLRQMMRRAGDKTGDVAPACPPRLDTRLLRFIWSFPTAILPRIHAIIARERRNRSIFILRSRRERDEFLAKVPILGDMGAADSQNP